MIGVCLAISHFYSRSWNLAGIVAVMYLFGVACGPGGVDTKVFHYVLADILPL